MMTQAIIDLLTEKISAFPAVEKVILFGSRARGDHGQYSDIDIAVSGDIDAKTWSHIRRLADVEDNTIKTLLKIDIVRLERAGEDLQKSVRQEGKTLYER